MSGGDLAWPLRRAARLYAGSVAVIEGERSLTYAELAERVAGLAAGLEQLAVQPRGRVGFLGVNSIAHLECWLAIPAAGRVLVDLNFRLSAAELAFMVDDCELEVLIADQTQLDVARELRRSCASVRELVLDAAGECPEDCVSYELL